MTYNNSPKKNSLSKAKDAKPEYKGFFNYSNMSGIKEQLRQGYRADADFVGYVDELIRYGYKVSFSFSEKDSACFVSVFGATNMCVNAGYLMTEAHIDPRKALYTVWFVCAEVYEWGEWPVDGKARADREW